MMCRFFVCAAVAMVCVVESLQTPLLSPKRLETRVRFVSALRAQETTSVDTVDAKEETVDIARALLDAASSEPELSQLIEERFDSIDQEALVALTQADDEEKASAVLAGVKAATEKRMLLAKGRLETVLDAGELLEMDRRLTKLFKDGEVDAAFLVVLNANAAAAADEVERKKTEKSDDLDNAEQRARVMEHLYTRAQEEWEKRLPDQAKGVLHRVARTADPAIRRNILYHYLAPKTAIDVPGKDPVPLETPQPPLLSSVDFAQALAEAVAALRQLDLDGDLLRASIEDMRQLAKEARLVLVDTATDEAIVRHFEEDLSTTWPMHE